MYAQLDLTVGSDVDLSKAAVETVECDVVWLVGAAYGDHEIESEDARHVMLSVYLNSPYVGVPYGWADRPLVYSHAAEIAVNEVSVEEIK